MKSVLISIQPKWCELIANGKKTIEVRKTAPKLQTPFKCYIYCTLNGINELFKEWESKVGNYGATQYWKWGNWSERKGKVIGEFVCDKFENRYFYMDTDGTPISNIRKDFEQASCLKRKEIIDYILCPNKKWNAEKGTNWVYGWHISDLKIYDKPKELGEFWVRSNQPDCSQCAHVPVDMHPQEFVWHNDFCGECRRLSYKSMWATHFRKRLTRPPQAWCYVEELK